ncbi:hypothetical protein [Vallicoccus soli]|uniref:Uncharacterized protein n=1 Tax=Vallicoccus soli TaxID=2339232 RepID=A0A3A3YXT8_9ACTN|nr:hypothetical protein [Vallicoccus soli]RJK96468.1 hypothetical protein D5H78_09640 [Vallicoccus soli]
MSGPERPHRPVPLPHVPERLAPTGPDPATLAEDRRAAAESFARTLLEAASRGGDAQVDRLVRLADEVGLADLDAAWRHAESGTVAGGLRVLYLLQAWLRSRPDEAARLLAAGRVHADVATTVLGLPAHASPDDVCRLADDLVRGALARDLTAALHRGAALCRVVAAGRGGSSGHDEAREPSEAVLGSRLLSTADDLDAAARAAER